SQSHAVRVSRMRARSGKSRARGCTAAGLDAGLETRQTRPMAHRLREHEPLAFEIQRVCSELLGGTLEHFAQVAEDTERRIHESRKNLKRARAFLALVAPGLPKATVRREERTYRDVARRLSGARDAVVLRRALEAEHESIAITSAQLEAARAALQQDGAHPDPAVLDEVRIVLAQALERVPEWTSELRSWKTVAAGFAKTYRRARRQMIRAADSGDGEEFHEWRKHVKWHL